ncbi:hypothetical protein MNBD_ALPHA06-2240, partial [hydrothermal vent metagenome]
SVTSMTTGVKTQFRHGSADQPVPSGQRGPAPALYTISRDNSGESQNLVSRKAPFSQKKLDPGLRRGDVQLFFACFTYMAKIE